MANLTDPHYIPVPVALLEIESSPEFDLYIKHHDRFVKLASRTLALSAEQRHALKSEPHPQIYIEGSDETLYYTFMRDNIVSIAANDQIPLQEKSQLIYATATTIVDTLLQSPESKEGVRKTKGVAHLLLDQVASDHKAYLALIQVSSHDYYTYTHCINVSVYSLGLGARLGLSKNALKELGEAAILHDLGKAKIDSEIINKQGPLSDEEFEVIKRHPRLGHTLLGDQGETNSAILEGILHHHEKQDGTGYPDGLVASELSEYAQIITVADIFDALTTRRSYKPALTSFQALKMMKEKMQGYMQPQMLEEFVRTLH